LSSVPAIKWSESNTFATSSIPAEATIQTVYLPYSDATLLGFLVQAPTAEAVSAAGKAVAASIKEASGSLKPEHLKKAIAKAKFNAAYALDTRQGLLDAVSLQLLSGTKASVESTFAGIEKVSSQAASSVSTSFTLSRVIDLIHVIHTDFSA
jgi:ubiquinol-cytochrome c reductase core subunit 2